MHALVHVWKSEDNLVELVLSVHFDVGSGDQIHITRLAQKAFAPLSRIEPPFPFLSKLLLSLKINKTRTLLEEVRHWEWV